MSVKENVLRRVFEHAEFVNKQYKDSHVRFFHCSPRFSKLSVR